MLTKHDFLLFDFPQTLKLYVEQMGGKPVNTRKKK
jgi:hypothetical protein